MSGVCLCMCVCSTQKSKSQNSLGWDATTATLVQALSWLLQSLLQSHLLPHSVSLTCLGSRRFPGRNIYCGSPCGSGGYSHWGKQKTDEPGSGKISSRSQRVRSWEACPAWDHTGPWGTRPCQGEKGCSERSMKRLAMRMGLSCHSLCQLSWALWTKCNPSQAPGPHLS